jgi:hypothetical protein
MSFPGLAPYRLFDDPQGRVSSFLWGTHPIRVATPFPPLTVPEAHLASQILRNGSFKLDKQSELTLLLTSSERANPTHACQGQSSISVN